jgi:MIP family channel proteins
MVSATRKKGALDRAVRNDDNEIPFWRCLLAEFIGTFYLTFVSAAPIVISQIGEHHLQNVDKVIPAGALVAAMIYVVGPISGAHFNPAVTFAFALRRVFPWVQTIPYILIQLLGGFAAAGAIYAMFGNVEHLGANQPHLGIMQSFVCEVIFTFLLVSVILGTSNKHKIAGANSALAVGMTIALCGLVGAEASGGSMNPARSLCPALLSGYFEGQWLYLAGPLIGSGLAAVTAFLLDGGPNSDEKKAARGEERAS